MAITDTTGRLVYFNEAGTAIIGKPFSETGEMPFEEWSERAAPRSGDGEPVPLEQRPVWIALNERREAHASFTVTGLDRVEREISVTAFPLFVQADEFVGVVAVFWIA